MRDSFLLSGNDLAPASHVRAPRNPGAVAAAMLVSLVISACGEAEQPTPVSAPSCAQDGFLSTRLYGALPVSLDWPAGELACEGMPRPAGEGARIRLSGSLGDAAGAGNVTFILGLPSLQRGRTASELATNVTVIEEGAARFFATADADGCWTDVEIHEPLAEAVGSTYRIGGTVYCVSALAELNGGSSISFNELTFAARLNWDQPE